MALLPVALEERENSRARVYADDLLSILTLPASCQQLKKIDR